MLVQLGNFSPFLILFFVFVTFTFYFHITLYPKNYNKET